jgi:hypothetical protein
LLAELPRLAMASLPRSTARFPSGVNPVIPMDLSAQRAQNSP